MILILSNKWDLTVDFVVSELRRRGQDYLRINTEDLALGEATISLPEFHIWVTKGAQKHDLTEDVHVIWNRRPGRPFDSVPPEEQPPNSTQRFVNEQWFCWLEALQLLPDVLWINHPLANCQMENKVRQLRLASEGGFSVPSTIVSNDAAAARSHLERYENRVIAKALFSPLIQETDQDYFIFTNLVREIESDDDCAIRVSPCIFQEPIVPKIDYRVTVVGDEVIPVRIEPGNRGEVDLDWRTQEDGLRFHRCSLPDEVENLCLSFVKRSGLVFGALDLLEQDGRFFFLEINPNGEWGWLQKPNGIPIAETLCDLMVRQDKGKE